MPGCDRITGKPNITAKERIMSEWPTNHPGIGGCDAPRRQ
jgi:hypothetical protein